MKTKSRQRFQRKSAEDRRGDLIAAGIACLGKGGMAGFTIDRICKQAGISRGLVNHHFKTKDELLTCIYAAMTDHLVQGEDTDQAPVTLAQIIETSFDEATFDRANLRAWLAIWGQVPSNPALSELHRQRYERYRKRIQNALRAACGENRPDDDIDSMARQLIAIIDGLWLEYCLHSDGFSLSAARADCYRFLDNCGIRVEPCAGEHSE